MTEDRRRRDQAKAAAKEAAEIAEAEKKEKEKARILQQYKAELDRERQPILEEYEQYFKDLEPEKTNAINAVSSFFDQQFKITEDHPIIQFAVRISDRGITNQYHCQLHEQPNETGYLPTELNKLFDHLLSAEHKNFAFSNCNTYYENSNYALVNQQNQDLEEIANKLVATIKRKEWLASLTPEQRKELTEEKKQKEAAKKRHEEEQFRMAEDDIRRNRMIYDTYIKR